jgi:hypothetical protein
MAGEVHQLRKLIERRLLDAPSVPLVEVLAEFDYHNHSLPATWRWNQAITEVAQPLVLSADGIRLEPSATLERVKLSGSDISRIVMAYHNGLRLRQTGHGA